MGDVIHFPRVVDDARLCCFCDKMADFYIPVVDWDTGKSAGNKYFCAVHVPIDAEARKVSR